MKFDRRKYASVISKYNDEAMKYCLDVLEDRLLAGNLIKLACLRHLNDLKRIKTDSSFKYIYDPKKAEGMITFAELIPDVNSGQYRPLAMFQKFILSEIEGWIDPEINGSRFKIVFLSMARGNGKTDLASWIGLRDFLLGQPANTRQVIVASSSVSQTDTVYSYIRKAWNSLKKTRWFKKFASQIEDNSQEMRIPSQNSKLVKLAEQSKGGGNSYHPSLIVLDEWHIFKDRSFVDSLTSGNIMNPNARFVYISTAGTDPRVPMRQDYSNYSEQIANETIDDNILFLCWEQDSDNEAYKPETYAKSNPLYEVPARRKVLQATLPLKRKEFENNGDLPSFLVYQMNRWQNAKKNAYIPLDCIDKSIIENFDLNNREVYLGYDASLSNDDTSLVALIPYQLNGNNKFYVWQHSWIPTKVAGGIQAKMRRDAINYVQAEKAGYCKITESRFGTVNQDEVYEFLLKAIEKYHWKVRAFGYDAWGTGAFIRALNEKNSDWLLFPIRQGPRSLSEPTKWLQDSFNAGDITMPDDSILKAALSNAILTDKDNQLLIDKNMQSSKIDTADALIDACYQGMLHFTNWTNEKADKDKSPFAGMSNEDINEHFKKNFSF